MKTDHKKFLISLNIGWILVIFILCTLPIEDIPDPRLNIPNLDKAVHFGMFFLLSIFIARSLDACCSFSSAKIYAITLGIAFGYGGMIELLQHYVFNRSGDVLDLAADVAGGFAGNLCYPVIKRIFRKNR